LERIDLHGQPLNLDLTMSCGQAFRWYKTGDGHWRGVVRDRLMVLAVRGGELLWRTYPENDFALVEDYLRLSDDVNSIYTALSEADPHLAEVVRQFRGLRFLRQDPTECLLSFICSAANSIPRIMMAIEALAAKYGDLVCEHDESCYYAFPRLQALASARPGELEAAASLGFRGLSLKAVAQQIIERGEGCLMSLRDVPYPEARSELMKIRGVGGKIADCVCLFSLDKNEAVPVDTHVKQLAERLFLPEMKAKSITDAVYRRIIAVFEERYGALAGWAQQFLFYEDLLRTRALGRGLG
jgi:N-glycosylase/DNA lyase